MRNVIVVVLLGAFGCVSAPVEVGPVSCDGDVVVCAGEAVCEGEDPSGDGPAYVACPRSGVPVCRQRIGLVDTERPEQTPVCVGDADHSYTVQLAR